jgi:hypothetical protein
MMGDTIDIKLAISSIRMENIFLVTIPYYNKDQLLIHTIYISRMSLAYQLEAPRLNRIPTF